jgi:hypothetical protein
MPAEKLGSFAELDGQSVPSDGKSVPTPRTMIPAFPPGLPLAPRTPLPTEAARKRSRYADIWESMAQGNGHMSNQGEPSHHPRLINTQSPLAQELTTAIPTEQNARTDFAPGGNLSNRRWRSPPTTGRPRRVYIPAPSLSTNNRDLVREPQALVPNRFSTPVRATSAAVVCPTRQPRGPPPIEVLLTKPTSHHEGSKNFAARGRRRQSSGFVSTGVDRTTSGNTAASVSVSGIVSTGVTRTTSINTAAASISGFVSTGVARTTSGNTSAAAVSGTTAPISEHGGLVSEDTKNVASSAANRNGR